MRFEVTHEAPFPRERLFVAHRDAFPEMVRHLDEIRSVKEKSRATHADGSVVVRNRWQGSRAALPLLFQPLVPEQVLVWEDESRFDLHSCVCTWTIGIPGLGPMADVRGTHRYLEHTNGTRIELEGTFDFHPERAPQMPLPPGAAPLVERMIVALIIPLLEKSSAAMVRHLEHEDASRT